MLLIKSIDKKARLLSLGSDADPTWEYVIAFRDQADLDLLELAQNIYEKFGPGRDAVTPVIDSLINKELPTKEEIVDVIAGEKTLNQVLNDK